MKVDSTCPPDQGVVLALLRAVNDHDLDAFMATLHEDIVYTLHHEGFEPARGRLEVREAWDNLLRAFPDLGFDVSDVVVREGHAVAHWRMSGSLAAPWPLGSKMAIPVGPMRSLSLRGVDIFAIKDGFISRKDSYVDVGVWFQAFANITTSLPR
ncbi:MAG: hypothetical protein FD160_1243 [Caulobacteraceae bacterium]|nr:MAG: hypothetical protein FD160_1243 [Caulobacteraceae bacterium]